jgi:hypothetical protein
MKINDNICEIYNIVNHIEMQLETINNFLKVINYYYYNFESSFSKIGLETLLESIKKQSEILQNYVIKLLYFIDKFKTETIYIDNNELIQSEVTNNVL